MAIAYKPLCILYYSLLFFCIETNDVQECLYDLTAKRSTTERTRHLQSSFSLITDQSNTQKRVCRVQIPVDLILKALCNYNDVEAPQKKLNQKTTT